MKSKKDNGVFETIRMAAMSHHLLTAGPILCVAASVVASLLPPLLLAGIIDRLTAGIPLTIAAVLLYFGGLALEGGLSSAQESLLVLFGQKMTHALRSEMSRKLTRLPASTLAGQNPGEVAARFSGDVDTVEALFTSGIISMAADACRIISIMAVIAVKNTGIALVLLLVLPLFAVFTRHVQKRMLSAQFDNRRAVAAVSGLVPETLHNIRTIRALGMEAYMERRYDRRIADGYAAMERTNFYDAIYSPVVLLLNAVVVGIVMLLSALLGKEAVFEAGETVLVLDEIQDCPEARTALKFFRIDGRYDVIGTGSLLGVKGYGKEPKSVPVGSETVIDMYPLDFEEFLWANGISEPVIAMLQKALDSETPVPEALHSRMKQLLLQYAVVGGMPDAVQTFVDSKQMDEVLRIQRDIVRSYEDDMVKYAEKQDKSRIKECFQSIPRQLAKENKKFQYSVVRKGSTAAKYAGSLQWIEDAGIIARCYNLSITELPLDGNAEEDTFKVYMRDMGLFVSMLEDGTQYDILQGNLYGYKGAIFENLIADIFSKMGRKLYYFHKDSGLEVDFVIRYKGECTLVEVKAATGNIKSTKTILNHPEKYHVSSAIKLGDYNVGRMGQVLTLPLYMAFLLRTL